MKLQVFVWSDLFETGVELIDSQHQALVDLINQLGEGVMQDRPDRAGDVLERLKDYAVYHFSAEEAWSVEHGQPPAALAAHHDQHQGFLGQVLWFAHGWQQGDPAQGEALHRFLSAWLVAHILGEDRQMVQRLASRPGSELAQSIERLRANFLTSVRTFTNLMELRGGQLAGHARRTADLARKLAQQLRLDPATAQQVFLGALLHDVGKIGLPDDMLGKPVAALKGVELEMYRAHCVTGEAALLAIGDLHGAVHAVRSHHERWVGRGYPDGLAGELIPLETRIVAVANDMDSRAARHHRGAPPVAGRGTQPGQGQPGRALRPAGGRGAAGGARTRPGARSARCRAGAADDLLGPAAGHDAHPRPGHVRRHAAAGR